MRNIIFTALFIGLLFICSPLAHAGDVSYQIDVGSFDIWKNSAGQWIPSDPPNYTKAYKPNDTVEILPLKIPAPAGVTGVKSVKFASDMADWQLGNREIEYEKYSEFFTTNLTDIDYTFSNNTLEVGYKIVLQTPERVDTKTGETLTTGKSEKKEWQNQTVEGYRYYLPILIEWEMGTPPDFYPTPEGETEWQEEFLTNAKTYRGEVGETLTIPITLHNAGSEAITDFGCTWYGAGWDKDKMVWKEEEIEVKQGEFTDYTVPVQVPNVGEETRLVFRANIDGKTPDTEVELENNITVITIQPDGLDLAVKLIPQKPFWEIPPDVGYTFPVVTIQGSINMENEMLFQADGFAEVEGIKRDDFLFVKARNEEPMTNSFGFKVTQPGIYKVKACIPAIDEYGNDIMFEFDMQEYKDINPANNCDELEVEVRIGDPRGTKPPEYKTPEYDGDDHFRIDLVG